MLNNINLDIGIIAIYYWGRSGSLLVGSLLDSHEEILTIPPGKFCYFYGRNEFWEKVKKRNYDIDEIIEYFYLYYYEIFNGKFAPNALNYHKMGENKEEHIFINKSEFVKWLKAIGKEIDLKIRRNFFIAIHYAYELSLGRDVSKKKYINHQLHDPDFYRTKKILDDFNDVKFIGTFRYPIRAFYSLIRNTKDCLNVNHFRAYKFEEYDLIYNGDFISLYNQFLMGWKIPYKELNLNLFPLYLDELHKSPKNVIKRLSIFLDIKENEVLLESTFNGLRYWGDAHAVQPISGFDINHTTKSGWKLFFNKFDCYLLNGLMANHKEYRDKINYKIKNLIIIMLLSLIPSKLEWIAFKKLLKVSRIKTPLNTSRIQRFIGVINTYINRIALNISFIFSKNKYF